MSTLTSDKLTEYAVDPARLESGRWCHRAEKTLGEGDIRGSYSADRIGLGKPVRKPFRWQAVLWTAVSIAGGRETTAIEAYRLVHPQVFDGAPITYADKTADAAAARADPMGFYHGMAVRHGGETFVLCGPPARFVAGQTEQLALF